jgi:hypothetical protein
MSGNAYFLTFEISVEHVAGDGSADKDVRRSSHATDPYNSDTSEE